MPAILYALQQWREREFRRRQLETGNGVAREERGYLTEFGA